MRKRKFELKRTAAAFLAVVTMALTAAAIPSAAADAKGVELYVSPSGDDSAEGTVSAPLRTLEGARNAVRRLREGGDPEGGITVYLREGVYYQPQTFEFTSADSGSEDCPITYASYNGESVTITGGVTLDPDKFTAPSDEIKGRLQSDDAKANVVAYDLGADGVDTSAIRTTLGGSVRIDSRLFVDGERAWPGRFPNYVVRDASYKYFDTPSGRTFVDIDNRVKNWKSVDGAMMYGMFGTDWVDSYAYVTGYNASTNTVTISGSENPSKSGRYFFYNVLEEVDTVCEYYLDNETGILYLYAPENYKSVPIRFAVCRNYVMTAQVDYYTFDGITFECGVDSLISLNGNHNTFKNCIIRNCSESGLDFVGDGNVFYNNELSYIGGGGISGEMSNTAEMIHSQTVIDNNLIHDYAELHRVYNAAIGIGQVKPGHDGGFGVTISHNEIYNGPHLALSYLCRDALFEYNYIHDVCYEAGDAGAVYDGTWISNGMVFRNNIIKDIHSSYSRDSRIESFLNPLGYYCDDSGAGKHVYSNLFINIDGAAIATSGQDNNIHDNIIISANKNAGGSASISADSRNYYKFPNDSVNGWENITVYNPGSPNGLWVWFYNTAFNPSFGTEKWAFSYPWTMLVKTTNVYDIYDLFVPYAYGDSKVRQNALYPSTAGIGATKEFSNHVETRDNVAFGVISDFGFADYEGGNYAVSDDANIYTALPGFKPCDAANVGRRAAG